METSLPSEELVCSACAETIPLEAYRNRKARRIYCRDCWMHFVETKFRKQLFTLSRPEKGSSGQIFQPAETILVNYDDKSASSSSSSIALICLLHRIRGQAASKNNPDNPANRPFPFNFVIHLVLEPESIVDTSNSSAERQRKTLKALQSWSDGISQFPILVTSLESSLVWSSPPSTNNDDDKEVKLIDNSTNLELLTNRAFNSTSFDILLSFINQLKKDENANSQFNDALNILRTNATLCSARDWNCSKIILPEDQTSIATKPFIMMSNLRGYQVPDEMSFRTVIDGLTVARPLCDISSEDLTEYLKCLLVYPESTEGAIIRELLQDSNISNPKVSRVGGKIIQQTTVEHHCSKFIRDLQQGFPSTVSTVAKIGDKIRKRCPPREEFDNLESFNEAWANVRLCHFCHRAISPNFSSKDNNLRLCEGCNEINNFSDLGTIIRK